MSEKAHCELCGRAVSTLTRHHLIPRTRHSNKRNKRDFSPEDVKTRIACFGRPCQNHVKALYPDKMLEREYNTLERLRSHPDVAKFVEWIRKKPEGFRPANQASAGKRQEQRRNANKW